MNERSLAERLGVEILYADAAWNITAWLRAVAGRDEPPARCAWCCESRVEAAFAEADTFFPHIDAAQWAVASEEHHEADERNPYPYTFVTLCRK